MNQGVVAHAGAGQGQEEDGAAAGSLHESAVEQTACRYLEAAAGDLAAALRIAVADLLDIQAEAEWRRLALDQWVSRGYVRGRAAEVLDRPGIRRVLAGGECIRGSPERPDR
jgi:hypothetical protein